MARLITASSSRCYVTRWSSSHFPPSPSFFCSSRFKDLGRRFLVLPVRCLSSEPDQNDEARLSLSSSSPSSDTPSSDTIDDDVSLSSTDWTYKWCAGLGGLGLMETAYLTYLKVTDSEVFCPVGGGTCGDVLKSDYAVVFGVPLPVIGMLMYGIVTTIGLQLGGLNSPLRISQSYGRLILVGSTTAMASASAYFLYTLSTKLSGSTCTYCLTSALLSFSLFFLTLKDVKMQEIQRMLGVQILLASIVIATLSASYSTAQPVASSAAEVELPYFATEVTTPSSPFAIELARHLNSIGAKMYGAFWCSHCQEQKQMLGQEAAKILDYVECFPDGYRKGVKIEKACAAAGIQGFPTWVINGQVFSGELDVSQLAEASGFSVNDAPKLNQLE